MSSRYLYLVRMDVAHDLEATFNDVYDTEHVPLLQAVPGIGRATRYRSPSPTDPRYIAAYELESPAVLQSAEWKTAGEAGRWPKEIRPHTMNRHLALYEWVGSNAGLTYRTPYVFWVFMDVEKHREDLFNELYDAEHVPLLLKLPGCVNVARYRTEAAGEPRYLAAYEVDRTDLPMSKLWNDTSDIGRWKPEVRPYTYNKHYIVSERIWPRLAMAADKFALARNVLTTAIRPALTALNAGGPAAERLVLGTGIQESLLVHRRQLGNGPARGLFQMEPATHDDCWENFLKFRAPLAEKVRKTLDPGQEPVASTLEVNDRYAAAMCRVRYLRVRAAMPPTTDIRAMANYWKQHYNTALGAGTPEEFLEKWPQYVDATTFE